jgi:DNA (cytosine-5)-methyltransferase 1
MDTIFATLGENKGIPRVYLQGQHLARHTFNRGDRYDRVIDNDSGIVRLKRSEFGKYIVSGKANKAMATHMPVIDVNTKELGNICSHGDKLTITLTEGVIEISSHHLDQKRKARELAFTASLEQKRFTKGTFCVGIGMATLAMDNGFEQQGFSSDTKWVVDREIKYLNVFMKNNAACTNTTQVHCADLEELDPATMLSQVDICQFSLDCAGHSPSGKSKNKFKFAEQHSGSTGVYGLLKSLETINAGIYISENVTGAMDSTSYMLIKSTLDYLGYNVFETILDSEQSGCIENRERYWFCAISKGLAFDENMAIPTYSPRYENLGQLMEHVEDDSPMWAENIYLREKAIRDEKAGKGFKRQLVNEQTTKVGVINRHYAKRQSTPPMVVRADGMERLFTVNEHAKIKDCPTSLVANLGLTLGHEGLGQGIDMMQGQGICEFLILALTSGHSTTITMRHQLVNDEVLCEQTSIFDSLLN